MSKEFSHDTIRALQWKGDYLRLLDQRRLPLQEIYLDCREVGEVVHAIVDLAVRGAPAIGIAAAWGVVLAAQSSEREGKAPNLQQLEPAFLQLNAARPTAVNLAWALQRMHRVAERTSSLVELTEEAQSIQREDFFANRMMSDLGAALIMPNSGVLTHCNTGSLATAGYGTALGVIRSAYTLGKINHVYACETRPWQQGARLTMWELLRDDIPATLITDSAAAHLMKSGAISWVIVGADRIVANGDVANKIGTYQLAIAARYHGVKFMVVAPSSTVDMNMPNGSHIHIELRDPGELLAIAGQRTVVGGANAWNPVFDVTPAELIDAIVTERGVVESSKAVQMATLFGKS